MENKKESFFKRISDGIKYSITGVKPDTWFSPQQPIQPMAPESVEGRQIDYPVGYNIQIQPRAYDLHKFDELRLLADNCSILRTVIETKKDQIKRKKFIFKLKGDDSLKDDRCKELENFFKYPDKIHTFSEWIGAILEDLYVIDAPTLYPQLTNNNKPYSFHLVDGATITRKIDQYGRVPIGENDVAYQQILKGVPAVDYTFFELIQRPRNIRTNKIYGFSPVEQIITIINTAIRRELNQLSYFTEGNTPNLIYSTPPEWNADMIKKFQTYWDSITQNQSKSRSLFVPSGVEPFNTKPEPLKNEFDDWIARVICYAFSISPSSFIKDMNRATAETSKLTAEEEGLLPTMQWIKELIDYIIFTYFKYDDIEFYWELDEELDPLIKAQTHKIYLETNVLDINEVRKEIGYQEKEIKEEDNTTEDNSSKLSKKKFKYGY